MKSTDQKKIAAYDKQHGEGAYSKELQKKLNKIYPAAAKDPKVKKKVDRIYNKMLDTNKSPQVEEQINLWNAYLSIYS